MITSKGLSAEALIAQMRERGCNKKKKEQD
jgi:hypothetical protein